MQDLQVKRVKMDIMLNLDQKDLLEIREIKDCQDLQVIQDLQDLMEEMDILVLQEIKEEKVIAKTFFCADFKIKEKW